MAYAYLLLAILLCALVFAEGTLSYGLWENYSYAYVYLTTLSVSALLIGVGGFLGKLIRIIVLLTARRELCADQEDKKSLQFFLLIMFVGFILLMTSKMIL